MAWAGAGCRSAFAGDGGGDIASRASKLPGVFQRYRGRKTGGILSGFRTRLVPGHQEAGQEIEGTGRDGDLLQSVRIRRYRKALWIAALSSTGCAGTTAGLERSWSHGSEIGNFRR